MKALRTLPFAISWTSSGRWVIKAHVPSSAGYQAIVSLREWKNWPASKRDPGPWHRSVGKCPLCRFEATGQLLYPRSGSNQVGCFCKGQRSVSIETNTNWGGHNYPTSNQPPRPPNRIYCPKDPRLFSAIVVRHWPWITWSWSSVVQERHDEYYKADSLKTPFETIHEACIMKFLREAGFFYLIWTFRHSIRFTGTNSELLQFCTLTGPRNCTIKLDLTWSYINSNCEWLLPV